MPTFGPREKLIKTINPTNYNVFPWTSGVKRTSVSGSLNELGKKLPHMG